MGESQLLTSDSSETTNTASTTNTPTYKTCGESYKKCLGTHIMHLFTQVHDRFIPVLTTHLFYIDDVVSEDESIGK
jgi:hypothetical protein